jgi:hypothetical protein
MAIHFVKATIRGGEIQASPVDRNGNGAFISMSFLGELAWQRLYP